METLSKNAFHVDPKLWRSQQACEPRLGRFPKGQSVHMDLAGAVAPGGAGPGAPETRFPQSSWPSRAGELLGLRGLGHLAVW